MNELLGAKRLLPGRDLQGVATLRLPSGLRDTFARRESRLFPPSQAFGARVAGESL